jgi:putative transposase
MLPKKRQRRSIGHPGKPSSQILAPNEVWSADFKGQFKTGDGLYCYPLTVADGYSRFLIGCQALGSTSVSEAKPVFSRLFKEFGLPRRIRTDNGVPFATNTLARLSSLSAWWVRLGVLPELIEPGKPQQNGRHERMHRTLKAETTRPPAGNLRAQQRKFNRFRQEFNQDRPHEALDMQTPQALYAPSPRTMPDKLPPLEYPDRFEVRYVSANGGIRWNKGWVNVSITCAGEYVGLEEIDDGVWNVYFGALKLGRLLERHMRIEDAFGRLKRHNV